MSLHNATIFLSLSWKVMEQENRMLFARCNNLKRKRRSYQYKARPSHESSDEEEREETPDSQIGSMRVYQVHEESEGWSSHQIHKQTKRLL